MLRSGSIGREALRLEAPDFALTGMLADPLLPVREHRHDHPHFIIGTSGAYEHSVGSACAVAVAPFVIYYPSGTSHADRFLRGRGSFVALTLASGDPAGRPVLGTDASSQEAAAAVALGLTGHGSSNDSIAARVERLTTVFARAGADRTSMPKWLSSAYSSLAAADAGFNVSRVADLVGVHRVHLARAFRSRFGCSPVAFLRARRLERAAGLLMDAERPIVDVAQDCGFVDQAHLTREFSDMFGVPPGAWRTAELQKFKTLGCQHH